MKLFQHFDVRVVPHPDRAFECLIRDGHTLSNGLFAFGYGYLPEAALADAVRNLYSKADHPAFRRFLDLYRENPAGWLRKWVHPSYGRSWELRRKRLSNPAPAPAPADCDPAARP